MTSADVQLIGRIRLQKHVPRAGSFEVYSGIIARHRRRAFLVPPHEIVVGIVLGEAKSPSFDVSTAQTGLTGF